MCVDTPSSGTRHQGYQGCSFHRNGESFSVGEPVLHHGFVVRGEVSKEGCSSFAPYDGQFSKKHSFGSLHNVSNANGLDVNFASIEGILTGGVKFRVAEWKAGRPNQRRL